MVKISADDGGSVELVCASDVTITRPMWPEDIELRVPADRRRILLAYGKWTTASGREVIYNRRYRPLWQRQSAGEPWQRADYAEWVKDIVGHEWFYYDGHTERQKVKRATDAMRKLGIVGWG